MSAEAGPIAGRAIVTLLVRHASLYEPAGFVRAFGFRRLPPATISFA